MSSRDLSGRPKGDIGAGVSGGSGEQRRAQRAAAAVERKEWHRAGAAWRTPHRPTSRPRRACCRDGGRRE